MLYINTKKGSKGTGQCFNDSVSDSIQKIKKVAMTYSPTGLPQQYHRRQETLLLCSEWEQVWPSGYLRHQIKWCLNNKSSTL